MGRMEQIVEPGARFAEDTANHQMTVLLDQGVYRHLRFKAPGTSFEWFEVLTSPGLLTINGDMGTFTFSRLEDMFEFFKRADGGINAHYWTQKCTAYSDPVREYSPRIFRQVISEAATEQLEDEEGQSREEALGTLEDEVLRHADAGEEEARAALDGFEHGVLEFSDSWEYDFRDYNFRYLWCLHAIVHGINQYMAYTRKPELAAAA
jgi:hypothetical protein